MEVTHITSNPRSGKLGTTNKDDDDDDGDENKYNIIMFIFYIICNWSGFGDFLQESE